MKKFVFVLIYVFVCNSTIGQTYSTSQLKGTWIHVDEIYEYDDDYYKLWAFSDDELQVITHTGEWYRSVRPDSPTTFTFSYPYYLSDTKPYVFNYAKVGKRTKGKYLVRMHPDNKRFYAQKIEIKKDSLIVALPSGDYSVYKRYRKKKK